MSAQPWSLIPCWCFQLPQCHFLASIESPARHRPSFRSLALWNIKRLPWRVSCLPHRISAAEIFVTLHACARMSCTKQVSIATSVRKHCVTFSFMREYANYGCVWKRNPFLHAILLRSCSDFGHRLADVYQACKIPVTAQIILSRHSSNMRKNKWYFKLPTMWSTPSRMAFRCKKLRVRRIHLRIFVIREDDG